MRCGMNEECFQIISGIVYPRIGFVARSIRSFACAKRHSPKKARNYPCNRAKPVIVPTLDPRDPKTRPKYRLKLWPNTEYRVKERDTYPLLFFITRKTWEFLRSITKSSLDSRAFQILILLSKNTCVKLNKHFSLLNV